MEKKKLIMWGILVVTGVTWGQVAVHNELVAYKEQYPEQSSVKINDITHTRIDFNKADSIIIETTEIDEVIYLDKNASNYAERTASSSYFRPLKEIEAKVYIATSEKKYKTLKVKEFKESTALSNSFFFDDSKQTKFTLSSLREGAKSYVKEVHETTLPHFLSGCYFGHYGPVENQEFKITVHKDIRLTLRKFNGIDSVTTYSKEEKGDYVIHKWVAKNLQEFEYEGSSPTVLSRIPHIYPTIHSYRRKGKEIPVLRNLTDLHDWYTELLEKSGVEHSEELKDVVDSITVNKVTDEEKVQSVFEWVQKNIKYVAYEDGLGGFVPRPPQTVYARKYGDCKDVALLQVKMLEYAGVNANVGWVGTRDKPYSYEELPAPGCDNHMIAAYERKEDDWVFLDATGTYTAYGYPSAFIQEKEVLVHKQKNDFEVVKVGIVPAHRNKIQDHVSMSLDNNTIKGDGEVSFTGYLLSNLKYKVIGVDSVRRKNTLKAYLEKGSNKFFFDLKKTNLEALDSGSVTYSITLKDYVKKNGDEYYINLNLDKILSQEKIDKTRKNAIEHEYYSVYDNTFELDLKNRFDITYLPKNRSDEDELFKYEISYELNEQKIIYHQRIEIKHLILEKVNFPKWNSLVKSLNKAYKEVVVLKEK